MGPDTSSHIQCTSRKLHYNIWPSLAGAGHRLSRCRLFCWIVYYCTHITLVVACSFLRQTLLLNVFCQHFTALQRDAQEISIQPIPLIALEKENLYTWDLQMHLRVVMMLYWYNKTLYEIFDIFDIEYLILKVRGATCISDAVFWKYDKSGIERQARCSDKSFSFIERYVGAAC